MNPIPTPADHLERGRALLQAGDRTAAGEALVAARGAPETCLAAHSLIEAHRLNGCFSDWMGVDCRIAPADDIFRFFLQHPLSSNPIRDYLADGWRTLSELLLLLEAVGRPLGTLPRVLEFASGHGRFTRHLVQAIGTERLAVSDVVPDAVAFARDTFHVTAIPSTTDPAALQLPAEHDLVFVLSLFSHLPRSSWAAWLRRLFTAVRPGGLLVFSTHGAAAAARQSVTLDADGFFFAPSSESQAIDGATYGTAFTSDAFVRACIADVAGPAALLRHAPQYFWHHQDAYVLQQA